MGIIREIEVELRGENNETYLGKITIETSVDEASAAAADNGTGLVAADDSQAGLEADPVGASSYVIAVVLIYGLSIVFLIASHVIIKKRELHRDNEKQINKWLEQAPVLREKSARASYKNLKHSIIPVVALSPAKDLVTRRKSFASLLVGLHVNPPSRRGSQDKRGSVSHLLPPVEEELRPPSQEAVAVEQEVIVPPRSPRLGEEDGRRMSTIEEESDSELDRSQAGSFKDKMRGARAKSSVSKVCEQLPEEDTSSHDNISVDHGSGPASHHSDSGEERHCDPGSDGGERSVAFKLPGEDRPCSHFLQIHTYKPHTADSRSSSVSRDSGSPPREHPPEKDTDRDGDKGAWTPGQDTTLHPKPVSEKSPGSAETEHLLHVVTCL